jgi:hypothetical protein
MEHIPSATLTPYGHRLDAGALANQILEQPVVQIEAERTELLHFMRRT